MKMIDAHALSSAIWRAGITIVCGVPCSELSGVASNYFRLMGTRYVAAANEGSAMAIAAGARLAGTASAVLLQNSGLGNLLNPLTSLCLPYGIPCVMMISLRSGGAEEPEHSSMACVTEGVLDLLGIRRHLLSERDDVDSVLRELAQETVARAMPTALLIPCGAVCPVEEWEERCTDLVISKEIQEAESMTQPRDRRPNWPSMQRIIETTVGGFREHRPAIVCNLGVMSRILYSLYDDCSNFYML